MQTTYGIVGQPLVTVTMTTTAEETPHVVNSEGDVVTGRVMERDRRRLVQNGAEEIKIFPILV